MTAFDTEPDQKADLASLILKVGGSDRAAFRELYAASIRRMYGISTAILRNKESAEDALQEAYAQIWLRAGSFDPARGQPLAWMGRILRNIIIDRYRASRQAPLRLDEVPESLLALEIPLPAVDLKRCLSAIPAAQRHVILLSYVYGLTYDEISLALDVPVGTIKSRVIRGMRRLRTCLDS